MLKDVAIEDPSHGSLGFGSIPGCQSPGITRTPWPYLTLAGRVRGWCCQCLDGASFDTWADEAASYILLEPEWKVWRHLPTATVRCRWLRGRVAAKDAVRLLLLEQFSIASPLETVGILPDLNGQPQVYCKMLPGRGSELSVSISHCGSSSVAFASQRSLTCHNVGIDVASQTENHDGLAEGGFIEAETALLEDYPAVERPDWLLRLWCAKEAVGKALGVGLMGDPLSFIVRRIDPTQHEVEVEANPSHSFSSLFQGKTTLTARVGSGRSMAFAVAHQRGNQ